MNYIPPANLKNRRNIFNTDFAEFLRCPPHITVSFGTMSRQTSISQQPEVTRILAEIVFHESDKHQKFRVKSEIDFRVLADLKWIGPACSDDFI